MNEMKLKQKNKLKDTTAGDLVREMDAAVRHTNI